MPIDYLDINQFVKPADVRDIVDYASDGIDAEQRMLKAFDHLNAVLTPVVETALAIDLRGAIDEYQELIGPRPDATADLEEWQPGFDAHLRTLFLPTVLEALGDGWQDTYLVNSDLDTDADLVKQAARVGADAILDTILKRSSKNKMLSAVGIVPASFDDKSAMAADATSAEEDFGLEDAGPVSGGPLAESLDDFGMGLDAETAPPAKPKKGRPFIVSSSYTTNPDALRVLLAVCEHASDSDAELARNIFGCSRSQVGNYRTGKMPFAPTPAQLQQLRDLAFKRATALTESLRVPGQ